MGLVPSANVNSDRDKLPQQQPETKDEVLRYYIIVYMMLFAIALTVLIRNTCIQNIGAVERRMSELSQFPKPKQRYQRLPTHGASEKDD